MGSTIYLGISRAIRPCRPNPTMSYERVQLAVDLAPRSEEPRRKIEALRYVAEALGGPNAT